MQKIEIQKLIVPTLIGVYDWERESTTDLIMSIQILADLRAAMRSDDVQDTIDYAEVANEVKSLAANTSFELLEALGKAISEHLLSTFSIEHLSLRIEKPGILPDAQTVSVSMAFNQAGPITMQEMLTQ